MDPITLGVAFTVVTVGSLVKLHFSKVHVPRVGRWRRPPTVYVGANSPVSWDQVEAAVQWWRARGFALGDVVTASTFTAPPPGGILVGPPSLARMGEAAGAASWLTEHPLAEDELGPVPEGEWISRASDILGPLDGEGWIRHAQIGVDPVLAQTRAADILRHELGHALGFLHCETALFGRRRRDSKSGRRKAGAPRLRVVGRKSGHVMHPTLAGMGEATVGMVP
jgi:hypothetical protein